MGTWVFVKKKKTVKEYKLEPFKFERIFDQNSQTCSRYQCEELCKFLTLKEEHKPNFYKD